MGGLLAIALAQGCKTPDVEVCHQATRTWSGANAGGWCADGKTVVIDNREVPVGSSGKKWSAQRVYIDKNDNGTLDTYIDIVCKTRAGSFGIDDDCHWDETILLNNGYEGGYFARRGDGTYVEIGKRSVHGKALQAEFEELREDAVLKQ